MQGTPTSRLFYHEVNKKLTTSDQYYFAFFSSDTVNLYLPLALLAASTLLPFLVAILDLKPCLLALFLLDGWNVLFIILNFMP